MCEGDIVTINEWAGQYTESYRYNLLLDALTGVVGWLTGDAEAYQQMINCRLINKKQNTQTASPGLSALTLLNCCWYKAFLYSSNVLWITVLCWLRVPVVAALKFAPLACGHARAIVTTVLFNTQYSMLHTCCSSCMVFSMVGSSEGCSVWRSDSSSEEILWLDC